MSNIHPVARDFILFCIQRRSAAWPGLYDEMCWVAGHHLFQGLGYPDLKQLGLSFGLGDIDHTLQMIAAVTSEAAASRRN